MQVMLNECAFANCSAECRTPESKPLISIGLYLTPYLQNILGQQIDHRLIIINNNLHTAIEKQQLSIHYQPVIDLKNNRVTGFEALLRWNNPVMGSVSPEQFIRIAESTGQIRRIGERVLEKACAQIQKWNLQFSPEQGFRIAVNLSGATD